MSRSAALKKTATTKSRSTVTKKPVAPKRHAASVLKRARELKRDVDALNATAPKPRTPKRAVAEQMELPMGETASPVRRRKSTPVKAVKTRRRAVAPSVEGGDEAPIPVKASEMLTEIKLAVDHKRPRAMIDFETYYDASECTVKKLGNWAYCHHPLWEAYLVSIVTTDGITYVGDPARAPWEKIIHHEWWSHNAAFDRTVYETLMELYPATYYFLPRIWNCSANLSVYFGAPRALAGAMKALLDVDVSKNMRTWAKGKTGADIKAAGKWDQMCEYCLDDSKHALELVNLKADEWPIEEQAISILSYTRANRGFYLNKALAEQYVEDLEQFLWKCRKDIPWAKTLPDHDGVLATTAVAEHCRKVGIEVPASLAEDDWRCKQWEDKYGDKYTFVAAMRDFRKGNMHLKRIKTMLRRLKPDGRVPYGIKYFGGHTGRWSGDAGLNVQNQMRKPFTSKRMPKLSVDIRKLIIAPPGKKLGIVDLAQIEPRCQLWIGERWDTLQLIRDGASIYEVHARETMGWKGDFGTLKAESPDKQFIAKRRVLSLGYGAGAPRFRDSCAELDYDISPKEAEKQVADFREKSKWIVDLWNSLRNELIKAARAPERRLEVELPSGRKLRYMNIKNIGGNYAAQVEIGGNHRKLYGGLLFENLIQAIARDVYALCLLRCAIAGFDGIFDVHDEGVYEVDEKTADKDVKEIEQLMSVCPDWLEGCPVGAEGHASEHYMK